tara:strand:- start:444 stop:986 length:543 start_codon:yes stop_codon:yes gene_type:complete
MDILIVGDSFAVDNDNKQSWQNRLKVNNNVVNKAVGGISEYRIYKQLVDQIDEDWDKIIVVHTSPYRVHTRKHPIHEHGDLMLNDIEHHASKLKNKFNKGLQSAKDFFTYHYDEDYFTDVYILIRSEMEELAPNGIHLCAWDKDTVLYDAYNTNPGSTNWLNNKGHEQVWNYIDNLLEEE